MLLTPMIFGLSGLLMGILNAHQHFLLPSLAPAFYSGGIIFGVLAWVPKVGIFGLAWGTVLGAGLHLLVQLPGLSGRQARFYPSLGLASASVRQVGALMAPRLLGAAAVEVNFLVNTVLASGQPEGSLTALTSALAIMLTPQQLIAQAMAIAALPTFSSQVARGEYAALRRTIGDTLRGVVYLALPASLGLILLRKPLVAMFFQGGAFDSRSTDLVAWGLLWYAAGLLGHSLLEVVVRAFYAMQDTRTPVAVGVSAMALNVILSLLLAPLFVRLGWPPHGALALANSLATALEAATLLLILRRRLSGLEGARLRPGLLASTASSLAMALALGAWSAAVAGHSAWLVGGIGVLIGGLVYFAVSRLLRAPEAHLLPGLILERLRARGS
jgi:putative peptidoglycan lipid II flippase